MQELSTLANILLFTFIGSVAALFGGFALLAKEKLALKISHLLASLAAGVLLGSAFFDLLPEAVHEAEALEINVFFWALFGIILFFLIERSIHWFHHHEEHHEHQKETKSTLPLIIIGDSMHNFIDGIVIAATFMTNTQLGIVTAFAVFAHELPQEIGDFGLMLHKGMKRKKIIFVNLLSAGLSFLGALITYALGNVLENYIPVLLAITAGFFIYIATSDLIPEIHYERRKNYALIESFLLLFGIFIIWLATNLIEHAA